MDHVKDSSLRHSDFNSSSTTERTEKPLNEQGCMLISHRENRFGSKLTRDFSKSETADSGLASVCSGGGEDVLSHQSYCLSESDRTKLRTTDSNAKNSSDCKVPFCHGDQKTDLVMQQRTAPKTCKDEMSLENKKRQFSDIIIDCISEYARTGDHSCFLVQFRQFLSSQDENGDNFIHLAVLHEQASALKHMLSTCISLATNLSWTTSVVNAFNKNRETPLHMATIMGHSANVEALLHHGADPFLTNKNGNTCFHLAAKNQDYNTLKQLCKWYSIHQNEQMSLDLKNFEGSTPLHILIVANSVSSIDCVRLFIEHHASADVPHSCSGKTPLHMAVEKNDVVKTAILITEGNADVNAQRFDGCTALHIAASAGMKDITKLLIAAGANLNIKNYVMDGSEKQGKSPLEMAKSREIHELLYGCSEDISKNAEDDDLIYRKYHHGANLDDEEEDSDDDDNDDDDDDDDDDEDDEDSDDEKQICKQMEKHVINSNICVSDEQRIASLSADTRHKLSLLLDDESVGWKALAKAFRLQSFIDAVDKDSSQTPTSFLLNYLDSTRTTVDELVNKLALIGRRDCVDVCLRQKRRQDTFEGLVAETNKNSVPFLGNITSVASSGYLSMAPP